MTCWIVSKKGFSEIIEDHSDWTKFFEKPFAGQYRTAEYTLAAGDEGCASLSLPANAAPTTTLAWIWLSAVLHELYTYFMTHESSAS
jgi:hypothetical protein